MRMELNNHAKNIVRCDGRLKENVRKWLDDVTAAKGWSQATDRATLKMVGYTSCGQLRTNIQAFIDAQPVDPVNGQQITWEQIRAHVVTTFLEDDEDDRWRLDLRKLRQAPYQSTREYGVAFSELARSSGASRLHDGT